MPSISRVNATAVVDSGGAPSSWGVPDTPPSPSTVGALRRIRSLLQASGGPAPLATILPWGTQPFSLVESYLWLPTGADQIPDPVQAIVSAAVSGKLGSSISAALGGTANVTLVIASLPTYRKQADMLAYLGSKGWVPRGSGATVRPSTTPVGTPRPGGSLSSSQDGTQGAQAGGGGVVSALFTGLCAAFLLMLACTQ